MSLQSSPEHPAPTVRPASAPEEWSVAVLREIGKGLDLVKVVKPQLHAGQVLVRLRYSGVCRSQLMEVMGFRGEDPYLPHVMGHEGVGEIVEIGPGVSKVSPGDRVVLGWIQGTGLEADPPFYLTKRGERINAGRVATFAEYAVVSESRVYLAPRDVSDRVAVLFGCALLTGAGIVMHELNLEPGQRVLISGAGGVGLAALLAANLFNVEIAVADPNSSKRRIARQLGARFVFDPLQEGDRARFRSRFPEGVDAAVEASGSIQAIEFAFASLSYAGGLLVFASHPPAGQLLRLDPHDLIRGKRIRGSWGGASQPDRDIPVLAHMFKAHSIDLGFMTPHTYKLHDVNQALTDLADHRAMRPLLSMQTGA